MQEGNDDILPEEEPTKTRLLSIEILTEGKKPVVLGRHQLQ